MVDHQTPPHDWREWRRMRAWQLSEAGWSIRAVADALGASPAAVSGWLAAAREGGPEALRARPRPGAPANPGADQRRLLADLPWHGPEAYGFRGEVWTCARVARAIAEEFGASHSKGHVSRIPRGIGGTPQAPITRAVQRGEAAIERWRKGTWPGLRRRCRRERRAPVFVGEAGFYLLPGVVRTYAPRGLTPVLYEWQTRDHLSAMGGVTPAGRVYTLARQETLNGLHGVAFLEHLLRHAGERLLVVWDRSPIHRRAGVTKFVEAAGKELALEPWPAYAPDLNPVEWLWRRLKQVEPRDLVCLDLEELHQGFHLAVGRVRRKPELVRSFFASAGLEL
jgi:transposase